MGVGDHILSGETWEAPGLPEMNSSDFQGNAKLLLILSSPMSSTVQRATEYPRLARKSLGGSPWKSLPEPEDQGQG